jgi:hypothetical protein
MAHVVLRKKNGSRGAIIAALRQTCQLTDKNPPISLIGGG